VHGDETEKPKPPWLDATIETEEMQVLHRETAERVLTDRHVGLLREIINVQPDSMRALARRVERDISPVSEDLHDLVDAHVIELVETGPRNSKRPVLRYDFIFILPIVFEGEIVEEDRLGGTEYASVGGE
jgi:predicted transcriptional regulator